LGKRVAMSRIRTQARGGRGIRVIKLNPGDALAAVDTVRPLSIEITNVGFNGSDLTMGLRLAHCPSVTLSAPVWPRPFFRVIPVPDVRD
jgi:hypothetical protein